MIIPALILAIASAAAPPVLRAAEAERPAARTVIVQVEGLACPFCVYGLERQFGRLKGVERADVDLGEGKATLRLKPGAKVTEAQIREAVRKAGFKASEIKGIEEAGGSESKAHTGNIERAGDRFLLVTSDGKKYLLFDQETADAEHALDEPTRMKLDALAKEKKRVTVRGAVHEHKGMPKGLHVESVEAAP